ncbi:InlB B-repeat-containing protein [Ruminococcus sp.]|uniref:InlB B-repeat-containing protein n=1 Tax=Ruminococcus sp. TaxID=41978 RepID=UPI003AB0ED2C
MAMLKKHKKTLLSVLQRVFCFILAATILGAVGVPSAVLALDGANPTVEIVGFMRGDSKDLRSSELLMAKVSNYDGNPQELTYEWKNKLGTYLYVFDKHDMAVVRGTKSEIEIYNSDKGLFASDNMSGRSYNRSYSHKGFAYAAVYGASVNAEKLKGGISVTVKDSDGNIIATASYDDDFKNYDLSKDMANAVFGVFEGESVDILNLLGQSSVVHVVCPACYVSQGTIISGSDCISLSKSESGYSITGLKAGEGVIKINLQKRNCKFHKNSENSSTTTVIVFKKPNTSTTATTLTLTNLDDRCEYYLEGVKGEVIDGKITFSSLTPSTEYTIEVRGSYIDENGTTKTAYAYVKDTTKDCYTSSVVFKLDDTVADIESIFGRPYEVAVKSDSDYVVLQSGDNGYTAELAKGNYKVFLKDGNDYKQIDNAVLTVDSDDNSIEIKYYSVVYNLDGGTLNGDTKFVYREGEFVKTIDNKPTKYEYVFDGWKCGESTYSNSQQITDSIDRKYELTANYGYENGKWDIEPKSPVKGTNAETYTYTFTKKTDPKVDYKEPNENDKPTPATQVVEYGKKIQVKPNGGVWVHDNKTYSGDDVAIFVLEKNIKLEDPTRTNYVFMGWDKQKGKDDVAYIFTAIWEVDKIGNEEKPDGIPDKYQKKVTFKVVNGTWEDKSANDISYYVTLLDKEGKWNVNGTARINIPTGMTANYGYEKGKWDIEPTEIVSGIEDVVYVYLFDKIAETEPQPQPTTVQPTPTVKTVVQEKTVYKTQYVEPITLKTGDNLTFLGVLVGLCAAGFAGTIIFGKKRSK